MSNTLERSSSQQVTLRQKQNNRYDQEDSLINFDLSNTMDIHGLTKLQ